MRTPSGVAVIAVTAVLALMSRPVAAQDTNYWTQQYGTKSELLGGAVVGSHLDLSSTFYNPGALGIMDNPEVLLSARAFEYQAYKISDAAGDPTDLSEVTFGTAPTLFTGLLPSKWLKGKLAYSVLTRHKLKVRLNTVAARTGDYIGPVPGEESLSLELMLDYRTEESWYGLTWARPLREGIGVGVTTYGAYRGQRTRRETLASVVTSTSEGRSTTIVDELDYWHFRFLWKVGLAVDYDPFTAGISITTPSVGLFGSGSVHFTRSFVGFADTLGNPSSQLSADVAQGLDTSYESSWAVALGAAYRMDRTRVHATAEWFAGVDRFTVMEPTFSESAGLQRRLSHELDAVLNAGIGVEHTFSERFACFGSFITDFSAAVSGSELRHAVSNWDIYHLTAGTAFTYGGLDLTLGLAFSSGNEDQRIGINPDDADEDNFFVGSESTVNVGYKRVKAIIGFSFSF